MSTLFRGGLSDWIRGAQSIIHEWRMLSQSLMQTFVVGFLILLLSTGYFSWAEMTGQERHTMRVYVQAGFNIAVLSDPTRHVHYTDETGQIWLVRSDKFSDSQMVEDASRAMFRGGVVGAAWGLGAMGAIILTLILIFYFTGRRQSKERYVRGAKTGEVKALAQALLAEESGPGVARVGDVTLPRSFEPQHALFMGASGTGKTQAISRVLEGVRQAGQRAVVYDVNGAFVEKFYRPDVDIILNPLDVRSPGWNIWAEVRAGTDFNRLAESLLPEKATAEPFWIYAARTVFQSVAAKLDAEAKSAAAFPANDDLVDLVSRVGVKELIAYCRGTDAAAIIDGEGDRMTASVRATLAAYMGGFSILDDEAPLFSIRNFITDERHDGWLFITSKNDQLSALRGLITLWVDTAVSTLLSLEENPDRRIWGFFDELTTLNKLSALEAMMSQSRKFGGCAALGFQSFAQLVDVYGAQGAEAIAGNCSTWFLFRPNDPFTAKWCSESLGKSEKDEAQEGLSVGRHEMRDGRTLQKQRVERAAVMPSELRNLKNLEFYLSLGRGYPIVKQQMQYRRFPRIAENFIERVIGLPLSNAEKAKARLQEKRGKSTKDDVNFEPPSFSATGKARDGEKSMTPDGQDADMQKHPWPTAEDLNAGADDGVATGSSDQTKAAEEDAAMKKAERASRAFTADGKIRPGFAEDALKPKRRKRSKKKQDNAAEETSGGDAHDDENLDETAASA